MNPRIIEWALKVNGEALIIKDELDKNSTDAFMGFLVAAVAEATGRLAKFIIEREKRTG